VLVVGAGAAWEPAALSALDGRVDIVVLKRCVDVTDLLATAASGQAQVAVVSIDAPGLDAAAVAQLLRHEVLTVVVAPAGQAGERAARIGARGLVGAERIERLPEAVLASLVPPVGDAGGAAGQIRPGDSLADDPATGLAGLADREGGRTVAVWGPSGAPGRTTVALGIAGELAGRGLDPLVIDADPWGGAVAQHLGVLDEVSGLLACARLSATGELAERFASAQRRVGGLRVVTGLPRPDRWTEVRVGLVEELVELGRERGPVVVDTGFSLEEDPAAEYAGRPGRNAMTLAALATADVSVVVGTADPVGLSRLARGLAELRELGLGEVHVVVNRWRNRLGWSQADVAGLVRGFGRLAGLHFLPDDRDAVDRALVRGRTLAESGDSPLARSFLELVDALPPGSAARVRSRTAGRGRRR
jgi:MinD-like ATPase involved in chromosome partitioning or flagellar assembly